MNISTDLSTVLQKLPYNDINRTFIDHLKFGRLADYAATYTVIIVAIAVHEDYDIESWKQEFSMKIAVLSSAKMRSKIQLEQSEKRIVEIRKKQSQSSDCFIATAAYGTMHESKIDVLRCLRDTKLISSSILTHFVRFYYRNSPPVAKYILNKPMLKALVRISLNPVIAVVRFIVRKEFPTWVDNGNPV